MGLSEYFGGDSKYLKASDLREGFEANLTIRCVKIEGIEDSETKQEHRKAVLYFEGKEKGLVLNSTNGGKLVDAYGDDPSGTIGKPIVLYRDVTQFRGDMVPCLRIRVPAPSGANENVQF